MSRDDAAAVEAIPAVARFRAAAAARRAAAAVRLAAVLGVCDDARVASLTAAVRRSARLTLNFHPDRPTLLGRSVLDGLVLDGRYYSQWTTGWSNGSRSAVAGGSREEFERELFGDALSSDVVARPIYGALDLTHDPHGGAPRFGSCFLVLTDECMDRATVCLGDSHLGPSDLGTIDELSPVLAGLFEQAALGIGLGRGLTLDNLLAVIEGGQRAAVASRELDGYIEAQVHGGVSLADDVVEIVADPSFVATHTGDQLRLLAERYRCALRWHGGSEIRPAEIPPSFRGPEMLPLAQQVARSDGLVDAAAIGRSLLGFELSELSTAGDDEHGVLQQRKRLWHCVVAHGTEASSIVRP